MFANFLPRLTKIITLNSPANNVNLFARADSPTFPITIICQVNSQISSNNINLAALEIGSSWVPGTLIYLDNNSVIQGAPSNRTGAQGLPGSGGTGGTGAGFGGTPEGIRGQDGGVGAKGNPGGRGGPAIQVNNSQNVYVILDNSTGTIRGGLGGQGGPGGFGGGGGGGSSNTYGLFYGFGGGGGAGYPAGSGSWNFSQLGDGTYKGYDGTLLYGGLGGTVGNTYYNFPIPSGGDLEGDGVTYSYAGGPRGVQGLPGDSGERGSAILGYANISSIIATGTITGETTNEIVQISNITNVWLSSANTSLGSTIRIPSTANVGDIAILFDVGFQYQPTANNPSINKIVPAGWSEIVDNDSDIGQFFTDMRATVSYKILEASDINSDITGYANTPSKILLTFRTNEQFSNVIISLPLSEVTTANCANVDYNMSAQTGPIIMFGHYSANLLPTLKDTRRIANSSSYFAEVSTQHPLSRRQYVKFTTFANTTPNNTTFGMDDASQAVLGGSLNILQSFFIKLS